MPAPYTHIVCCVEQSEASAETLREARRMHAFGPGKLTLLHVLSAPIPYPTMPMTGWLPRYPEMPEDAEKWLASHVQTGEDYVLLDGGDPAIAACRWAKDHDADLMVAAAHRGLAERILLGSFAGYLTHHSPCPVLIVRPIPEDQG